MTVAFGTVDTLSPDRALILGRDDVVSRRIIVAAGRVLDRGALLGRVTATGKHVLSAAAASDGSQTAVAILAEPVDASSADRETVAHFAGTFNERALVYGAGQTAASVRDALQARGIKLMGMVG